ncbi:coiled-coil domain-containing protein [Candidatus Wolbachia massiliensis]|uniref:Uncharacterized protein n=1 Tax=Candidatus Wolbachia massiliensis TaxID=1845000 RepID=A0A7L7YLG2_9RICK|nr:hypothetical protein [Candidatus Wolbachia massiliensis]QOD38092.1 hypothetical protein ID128_04710 [Candidatus Wolbachia massiliensis]
MSLNYHKVNKHPRNFRDITGSLGSFMPNTNNKINHEINVKKKEKKYSWSTVFAWLYLKTIGRILPKRWNKWAENILYTEVTSSTEPNLESEEDSKLNSENEEVQVKQVTSQDMAIQTECVETTDKNIEVDLKPEVAKKGSQSEIMSEDEGIQTEVDNEFADETCFGIEDDGLIDDNYSDMEKVSIEEDGALKEQLEDIGQELELERLQNVSLKKTNEDLESKLGMRYEDLAKATETTAHLEGELTTALEENKQLKLQLAEYEKDYIELKEVSDQIEKELSVELEEKEVEENLVAKLKEKSETIVCLEGELTKLSAEFLNETGRFSVKVEEKDIKINSLTEQLGKEQKQVESLKKEVTKLKGQLKTGEDAFNASEKEKKELEDNLATKEERIQELEEELIRLKTKLSQKEADSVKKHTKNSPYNEKYIKSYTDSLPLEDEVKTKYTPNSFLSRTSSTASIHSLDGRKAVKADS